MMKQDKTPDQRAQAARIVCKKITNARAMMQAFGRPLKNLY